MASTEDIPYQPPLPQDDVSPKPPSPPPLPLSPPPPPPSTQTSNSSSEPLDFDSDVGGKERATDCDHQTDNNYGNHNKINPSSASPRINKNSDKSNVSHGSSALMQQDDDDPGSDSCDKIEKSSSDATKRLRADQLPSDKEPLAKRQRSSKHNIEESAIPLKTYQSEAEASNVYSSSQAEISDGNPSDLSAKSSQPSTSRSRSPASDSHGKDFSPGKCDEEQEFDIIDAIESDVEDNEEAGDEQESMAYESDDDDEDSVDEDEIEAWLDEGMESYGKGRSKQDSSDGEEEFSGPTEKQKVVLKGMT